MQATFKALVIAASLFASSSPLLALTIDTNPNPNSVVLVQELTSGFSVHYPKFCPVSSGSFPVRCHRKGYHFNVGTWSKKADVISINGKRYLAQWIAALPEGLYAYTEAEVGAKLFRITNSTIVAFIKPGTIITNYTFENKSSMHVNDQQEEITIALKRKYGKIIEQMRFSTLHIKNVECDEGQWNSSDQLCKLKFSFKHNGANPPEPFIGDDHNSLTSGPDK
ncbi:hypothetical protein F9L33_02470 [Amylibacter sp. SFDW26]|uniref:hypothetical protein n=1 Tax=Amylibacter sp. SFDW26 TaxID=2652722 RepID=UPI0012615D18|nr:hypothetical protein [Amylibacter sp. SFDW26]KAB7615645.1 hypothetical protein F9L33_02470 [Amylibacter sp. SFDW26]